MFSTKMSIGKKIHT